MSTLSITALVVAIAVSAIPLINFLLRRIHRDRPTGRDVSPLWLLMLALASGVASAAQQWLPDEWTVRVRISLAIGAAVAAGAAGSFLSEYLAARRSRTAAVEGLAASLPPVSGSPAGLLAPGREVVGFVGRQVELADLIAWCESPSANRVRLVTGAGGVGKTRLAVELCARLEELGWRCVQVADGAEVEALEAARSASIGRILLVIDYAETRIGLPALLRAVAGDKGQTLRALLLARSAGEWWDHLGAAEPAVRELQKDAYGGEDLGPVVEPDTTDAEIVQAAVFSFAAALGLETVPRVQVVTGDDRPPILYLQAAALAAVLRASDQHIENGVMQVKVSEVLDELLAHEERFWIGTAARAGLLDGAAGLRADVLSQIVAASCLLGATTEDEAVELVGRVPGATGPTRAARWLRDLYPPQEDGGWLGSLQPDRLAGHHIVHQLASSAEFAEAVLTRLDDRQAVHAVSALGRASIDQPTVAPLLERWLPLLDRIIADLPPDLVLLTTISNVIPYPSLALAEADLAVTRRILAVLGPGDTPDHARWLTWLGTALAQTGRPSEALPATQEGVEIYRELADAYPDRYRPDLAASMSNLGIRLSELGRPAEALPVEQEAVEIRRELADAYPDRYRPDLAASLSNLGITFSALGRSTEALPVAQEAVEIRRELADAYPDRYRPDLAASLSNLGTRLSELGRPAEALPVEQEAVEIRRELADAYPDRYRPDLAASLSNLGTRLSELGRPAEALPVEQEAVEIYRKLAAAYPDRYRPSLTHALSNLGAIFSVLGRSAEALLATQEAVEIRRELADAYPDRYRPDLAASLSNLGVWFSALGRSAEALLATQEAVEIRRELADAYPDRYRPDLAASLSNLGVWFSALGRSAEALLATQEAVEIRRELADAYPDRYRPDLAASLSNLGTRLSELGRPAEALPVEQEAVEIRRELADAYPDRYRPDLAASLSNLGITFSALGRSTEALPVAQEAVEIRRELAGAYPDRYRPDLAASLSNLGITFSALGRSTEALPVAQEAVEIRRELADAYPDRYRPDLAASLSNLGTRLSELGRQDEAQAALGEAALLRSGE